MNKNLASKINNFLAGRSKLSAKVGKGVIGARKLPTALAALKKVGN